MFQEIITERLQLRSLVPDDAGAMFAYRSHPDVSRYQSWVPKSEAEVATFINDMATATFNTSGWYQIAIALRDGGGLVGDCGIHVLDSDSRVVEIGITIAPASQCRGYATEALRAIIHLLFAKLGKHRVLASVDPHNLPSMTLMEKLGLRKEGHFVQSLWFKDAWADDVIFAMLASEWRAREET